MEAFLAAVKTGDVETMGSLASADPSLVATRDENGATPLQIAVYYRQPTAVQWLKDHGGVVDLYTAAAANDAGSVKAHIAAADIDGCSCDGFTALGLACAFASTEVVRTLLAAGAGPNVRSRSLGGVAPLHAAVFGRNLPAVELLLEAGADPNAVQEGGFTPLMGAAQNGDAAIAALLLRRGADRSAKSDDGRTADDFARDAGLELTVL